MSGVFKALADKTRRGILDLLKQHDMTAGEIADNFSMSKPSISHHLSILKNAGLVSDTKDGQNVIYTLNTTVFTETAAWFLDFRDNEKK